MYCEDIKLITVIDNVHYTFYNSVLDKLGN